MASTGLVSRSLGGSNAKIANINFTFLTPGTVRWEWSHYYLYLVNFRLVWYIKYAIQEEKTSYLAPTGTLGETILNMCVSVSVDLLLYWFLHRLEHTRGFSKVIKAWEGLFINIFQFPSLVCPTKVLKNREVEWWHFISSKGSLLLELYDVSGWKFMTVSCQNIR